MPDDDDADVVYVVPTQRPAQVVRIAHVAALIAAGTHSPHQTATRRRNRHGARGSARVTLDKIGGRWLTSEFDHY